jgi:hypothetical protein
VLHLIIDSASQLVGKAGNTNFFWRKNNGIKKKFISSIG